MPGTCKLGISNTQVRNSQSENHCHPFSSTPDFIFLAVQEPSASKNYF